MILIMLEVGGLETLKRLHPAESARAIDSIKKILSPQRSAKILEDRGYLLFLYSDEEQALARLRPMLDRAEKLFEHENDLFQGNLIYVDCADSGDIRTHFERLKRVMLPLPEDRGILYSAQFQKLHAEVNDAEEGDEVDSEKRLYGMNLSGKRKMLSDIVSYSKVIAARILSDEQILELLEKDIFSQAVFSRVELDARSILDSSPAAADAAAAAKPLGYQAISVRDCFTSFLYQSMLRTVPVNPGSLTDFIVRYGAGESRLPALVYLAKSACLNYDLEFCREIESSFLAADNSAERPASMTLVNLIIRFYQAVICSDYEEVLGVQDELLQLEKSDNHDLEMEKQLVLSDCLLSLRYGNDALKHVKEVMYRLDKDDDARWLKVNANYLIAHAMLHKSRVSEAEIYFKFAAENALKMNCTSMYILSLLNRALIAFLRGALDRAHRLLDQVEQQVVSGSLSSLFEIYYRFMRIRVLFEEGRYGESISALDELISLTVKSGHSAGVELFRAWKARSMIFGGSRLKGIALLEELRPGTEKAVFEAEGRYLVDDYAKAAKLLNSVEDHYDPSARFISPYINLFRSGTINFEDRVLRYEGDQNSFCFYYLGLRMLVDSGQGEGGLIAGYKKRLRHELQQSGDPRNRIYCYLLAAASANMDSDGTDLDQLTMINRSFKYLQEYSGMTRDPSIRMNYMKKNYWNRKILEMAEKFKLVAPEKNSVHH